MGAQGTATLDFGAFPGSPDAVVAVTGQSGILNTSLVEAWVQPASTTDHSVAEHYLDPPAVKAGEIVAGTGFNIRGFSGYVDAAGLNVQYGKWNVAWVWN